MADGSFKVGITDCAQQQQGAVLFANLPDEGDEIKQGESFGSIESAKAISELIAPMTGKVTGINEEGRPRTDKPLRL
jgi:glycine cleavage system H protein